MKNVNQLDPETLASLRAAKMAQAQLRNMGLLDVESVPQIQQPIVVKDNELQEAIIDQHQEPVVKQVPVLDFLKVVKPSVTMSKTEPSENFISIEGLPSTGLCYQTTIYGQPLKLEDIIQVQTMDKRNYPEKFNEVFTRRIKQVQPDAILSADELYIALWLRANSFPDSRHRMGGFTCSHCTYKVSDPEYSVGFDQIDFVTNVDPEIIFEMYKEKGYIETELPSTQRKMIIHLRRRYHDLKVYELVKAEYYSKGKMPPNEYLTLLKLASLVEFEYQMDLKQKSEMIKNFQPKESVEFIKLLNKHSFSSEAIVNHTCPKCGEVTPMKGFPFRFEQYIPFD